MLAIEAATFSGYWWRPGWLDRLLPWTSRSETREAVS
jgi:hypothetical protein